MKERFEKTYRVKFLDEKINNTRLTTVLFLSPYLLLTVQEVRTLIKARRFGIDVPAVANLVFVCF